MKNIVTTFGLLCLLLFASNSLVAQPAREKADNKAARFERIKAARQSFIIERLALTEEEATAFFPVFWRYEEQLHALKKDHLNHHRERRMRNSEEAPRVLSEAEARQKIEEQLDRMNRVHEIKTASTRDYLKILPAAKLIKLEAANRDFRRELLGQLRRKRDRG